MIFLGIGIDTALVTLGRVNEREGPCVVCPTQSDSDLIFEPVDPGADGHGLDVPRLPVDAVVVTPGLAQRLIQPTLQLLKYIRRREIGR